MPVAIPTDWWNSDLIKIGVPTSATILTTTVAAVLSYFQVQATHRKDLTIERLRHEVERTKANVDKRSRLVMDIIMKIAAVDDAIGGHSGFYRAEMPVTDECDDGDVVAQVLVDRFNLRLSQLGAAIDSCSGARTHVLLLGDEDVVGCFELYMTALFTYQSVARKIPAIADVSERMDLQSQFERVNSNKARLVAPLTRIYQGLQ